MSDASTAAANEVYAIKFATADTSRSQSYLRYHIYGLGDQPMTCDYYCWVIRTPAGIVLFDTGFTEDIAASRNKRFLMPLDEGLAVLGIRPADVATIVLSHLHYDHIGNLELFPRASILVQRSEWVFWTGAMADRAQFAQLVVPAYIDNLLAARAEGRVQVISGDVNVAAEVSTLLLAGHTPGSQALLVQTPAGAICLAADAAHFYDELRHDWPFCIVSDLPAMYRSLERLRGLERAGVQLVPGHDAAVADRYPNLAIAGPGSVIRLS